MWLFKLSPRRQAVRADAVESQSSQKAKPTWRPGPTSLIAGVFFVLASIIFYYPADPVPFHNGQPSPRDLRSPVNYVDYDQTETQRQREAKRANTGAVLVMDNQALERIQSQLMNLPQDVRGVETVEQLSPDVALRWPHLTAQSLAWLNRVPPQVYLAEIRSFLGSLPSLPLVNNKTAQQVARQSSDTVYLVQGSALADKTPWRKESVIGLSSTDPAQRKRLQELAYAVFPKDFVETVTDYLLYGNIETFHYDAQLTEKLATLNAASVQADGVQIRQDQQIVLKNEPISPVLHQRLQLANLEYQKQIVREHPWAWLMARLGQALTVLLVTLVGTLFVTQMNPTLNTASRGWTLIGLLLLTMFIAKGSVSAGFSNAVYLLGIGPTLLTTIILVIAYNQRFALVISCLHSLLITLALSQGAEFFLTSLTGITVFTFGLKEIRNRGKLIEIGVFAAAGLLTSVWAIGMGRLAESAWSPGSLAFTDFGLHFDTLATNSLWAAGAGIGAGFVTLGILPFIERMFKITTAMTLLELCDLNQPLLRRLSQEAPGTFNHSLVVGTLAEAAGNAIGANGLLCRVGAYYHDIGKLSKPQYFIENQSGGYNRHEKLSPAMSLLIIVGHVKDGMELAREYSLPWIVHQFIGQHHGTTLVEYFFHAARERMAKAEGVDLEDAGVSDTEFRYPGPKPQTREAALLMICDGVESIVRSLAEPTPGRIETVVHKLVMKRLMDGQFSECDLTLRDLGQIEQSLVHTLAGVYHGRVAYPKPLTLSKPA